MMRVVDTGVLSLTRQRLTELSVRMLLVGLFAASCSGGGDLGGELSASSTSTARPAVSSAATAPTTQPTPVADEAPDADTETSETPPTSITIVEPDRSPDTRPQVMTTGEDVEQIYRSLYEIGQWELANPAAAIEPVFHDRELIRQLAFRDERMVSTTYALDSVEVWDRPTDNRALVIVRERAGGRAVFANKSGAETGRTPTAKPRAVMAVIERSGPDGRWVHLGATQMIDVPPSGSSWKEEPFIGLAVHPDITPTARFPRALGFGSAGVTADWGIDKHTACFDAVVEALGRYPLCFFGNEVQVPRNTFGEFLIEIPATDVVLSLAWSPKESIEYISVHGERTRSFPHLSFSGNRAWLVRTVPKDPGWGVTNGVRAPAQRWISDSEQLFIRSAPAPDEAVVRSAVSTSRLWTDSPRHSCLRIDRLSSGVRQICVSELLDASASPTVIYSLSGPALDANLRPVGEVNATLAVAAPSWVSEVTIDTDVGQFSMRPVESHADRWISGTSTPLDIEIKSISVTDDTGVRRTTMLPAAEYGIGGIVYIR